MGQISRRFAWHQANTLRKIRWIGPKFYLNNSRCLSALHDFIALILWNIRSQQTQFRRGPSFCGLMISAIGATCVSVLSWKKNAEWPLMTIAKLVIGVVLLLIIIIRLYSIATFFVVVSIHSKIGRKRASLTFRRRLARFKGGNIRIILHNVYKSPI